MHLGQYQTLDGNNRREETQEQELSGGLRVVVEKPASTNEGQSRYLCFSFERSARYSSALFVKFHVTVSLQQYISKTGYTPLPFKSGVLPLKLQAKSQKTVKTRTRQTAKPAKQTPLHNKNVISSIIAEKAKLSQEVKLEKSSAKVKPKLKAEVVLKQWEDDETDTALPKDPVTERTVKVTHSSSY